MTTNLMNVQEFAQALGVTTACIRRWILERKIDKVGRLVRIPTSELQNLINAGLRPAIRAVRHGK
jgi:excisionase family DNA binding protein